MSTLRPLLVLGAVLVACGPAGAQQAGSPFAGFSANRNAPISFQADRAEVFDQEHRAVLTGNVRVRQGESTLAAQRLVILYEPRGGAGGRPANPVQSGQGGQQNVRELQMEGGVIVTSRNQQATAERGTFNARQNVATLTGRVVLTQCQNVMTGERLVADLNTNRVRLEGGRVSGSLSAAPADPNCTLPAARPRPGG